VVSGWVVVVSDVRCDRVMCGADLRGLIPAVVGVVAALSSMINPPSMNSRVVCYRKDRDCCSCSYRRLCSFRFRMFGSWW
jgi:hypothetical protein